MLVGHSCCEVYVLRFIVTMQSLFWAKSLLMVSSLPNLVKFWIFYGKRICIRQMFGTCPIPTVGRHARLDCENDFK